MFRKEFMMSVEISTPRNDLSFAPKGLVSLISCSVCKVNDGSSTAVRDYIKYA